MSLTGTHVAGNSGHVTDHNLIDTALASLPGTYLTYLQAAMNPDLIIAGAITRDTNGAATSAPVVWPDGSTGTYTADTVSTAFPGAVDAYHVTKITDGVTTTYTQSAVTRDSSTGAVTNRPTMTVA